MSEQPEQYTIGAGLTIVGDIDAAGSLRVEGSVRGRVFVRGTLDVAPGGVVEGFVQALEIDVRGRLAGVVRAANEVRLYADGQVEGDVEAPKVRFVKGETPSMAPPPPPSPAEEEPIALPPAPAGQTPGLRPQWPPAGGPKGPPVWAPRSARPATVPPPAPLAPPAPEPQAAADSDDGPPPAPPSITGGQRQIVVKRK
jgi:hypothetical protein